MFLQHCLYNIINVKSMLVHLVDKLDF